MAVFTKKSATTNPVGRKTLADFSEWLEAAETLRRLRVEEQLLVEEIAAQAKPFGRTPRPSRVDQLAANILAAAKGDAPPPKVDQPEQSANAERLAAVRVAIERQCQAVEGLRISLSGKIYPSGRATIWSSASESHNSRSS